MRTDWRKWLAIGTGLGVEVRADGLQVTVVRVRPSEVSVLGSAFVSDFRTRPAAEWGTELLEFLKKIGLGHIAATVILPRRDVIVRLLAFPGVSDRDLPAAIQLQIDSLHPFGDESEIYYSFSRLPGSRAVLIGIARREVVDRYAELFSEAGLKVRTFTFSAAALYSGIRMISPAPSDGFFALQEHGDEYEIYGESEAKPVYSTAVPISRDRAVALAASELRLEHPQPRAFADVLPRPAVFPENHNPETEDFARNALAYATALAGACPWLSLDGNLLPADRRTSTSRVRLIPTFAMSAVLLILVGALLAHSSYADSRYLALLQHEIEKLEPKARMAESLDKELTTTRARSQALDEFRRRTRVDLDTMAEINKLIAAPGWVSSLDLDRETVQLAGEVDQAALLLKSFDESSYFERSEFTMPITKGMQGEMFRMRAARQQAGAAK